VLSAPVRHWYQYICPENEAAYLPAIQELLRFRYHTWAEVKSLRSRKDALRMGRDWGIFFTGRLRRQRPLLKDPFAVFAAPWFAQRLGFQVVVTIRHPAAFASSLKRLGWNFDFSHLLEQPLLMRDLLEPFRSEMEDALHTPEDVIGQGSLLWRIVYQAVSAFQKQLSGLQIVRHEDLSLDPASGFRQLYAPLGLTFSPQAEKTILNSSSADNPQEVSRKAVHSVRLDSQANLHNWKRRLEPEEIRRIRLLTEETAAVYYPEIAWE
jgi:hypothetical protein